MLLQRYLLAGFTLATIILFVIAKTTNTLPTTSCGHTWVGVYNGRCITLSLMSILGCSYARYYMHEKFTLAMENLVDAWCIHEWGNGRSERRWWEYDLPVLGTLLRSFGLYFSCWHWWYLYRVLLINFTACVYVTSAQLESILTYKARVFFRAHQTLAYLYVCRQYVTEYSSFCTTLVYFAPHAVCTFH